MGLKILVGFNCGAKVLQRLKKIYVYKFMVLDIRFDCGEKEDLITRITKI